MTTLPSAAALFLFLSQQQQAPEAVVDDATKARVNKVFAEYDKSGSPGCALGVIRDGRILYRNGYGSANLDYRLPLTPNSIFDIGSTSKQFSAMSILLLEKDGKLNIDDDIRKYVPEIPQYAAGTITIQHLLNHTSGLRDYLALARLALKRADDFYTDDDVLAMIARQKELNFAPGSEYLYSNSGYFLLSTIVKRASGGKTLRQFAEERILKPLGMGATHFHDDHTEIVRNRATGYGRVAETTPPRIKINMSTLDMVGDGGIYTSIGDLAKWDQNFYTHKVGGEAILTRMQTPSKLSSGKEIAYGLGLVIEPYRGLPSISHGGSWAGFRAELLRFPSERFSVICLCNLATANPSRLARQVADIFLEAKLTGPAAGSAAAAGAEAKPKPASADAAATKPAADATMFAGRYLSEELGGTVYDLKASGSNLKVAEWTFRPEGGDSYAMGRIKLQFTRDAAAVNGFTIEAGRVRNIRFTRVP